MADCIHHFHLRDPIVEMTQNPMELESFYRAYQNIYITAQQKLDDALKEAALRYCRENGCTDLYLLDGEELARRLRIAPMWDALRVEIEESLRTCLLQGLDGRTSAYADVLLRMKELEGEKNERVSQNRDPV